MHERQEREIRAFEIESRAFSQDVRLTEKKGRERERRLHRSCCYCSSTLPIIFHFPVGPRSSSSQQPILLPVKVCGV